MFPFQDTIDLLKTISELNPETVARENELGTNFGFREAVPVIVKVKNKASLFTPDYLQTLTNEQVANILNQLKYFMDLIAQAQVFNPANNVNPVEVRQGLINSIVTHGETVLNGLSNYFLGAEVRQLRQELSNSDIQELNREHLELKRSREILQKEFLSTREEFEFQKNKYLEDMESIRKFAAEKVVPETQSELFSEQADKHRKSARIWILLTILSLVLIILFSGWVLLTCAYGDFQINYSNAWEALNFISNKAIILFALIYLTYICAKSYFANRHNEAVNRHRHNVFEVFRIVMMSSSVDSHREIILSQAMNTIFTAQETGFIRAHQDLHPQGNLLDIMPWVLGKKYLGN